MGLEILLGKVNAHASYAVNGKHEHINELLVADTQHAFFSLGRCSHDTF